MDRTDMIARLIAEAKDGGCELVPLRAGSTGFWVEATGKGPIAIKLTNDRLGTPAIELTAA